MTASFPAAWLSTVRTRRDVVPPSWVGPEWRREEFDSERDDDPFEWLGFAPADD